MRKLTFVEHATDLKKIRPVWDELYRSGAERYTLFQTFQLNELAALHFARCERPYVIVAENDNGAAIIPACIRKDGLLFLGEELFDYRDVLMSDDDALQKAWAAIARLNLPVTVKATRGKVNWAENVPFAGAPYRSDSVLQTRHKGLERNLHTLQSLGCHIVWVEDKSKQSFVKQMYTLKGMQPSGSLFADEARIEAVAEMLAAVPSEVWAIMKDGWIVAAALTFIDGRICRFYGTYHDKRWADFSPGVSLLYRVVQHAQARGLDFDFMTGEQPYKLRFATHVVPLYIAQRRGAAVTAA